MTPADMTDSVRFVADVSGREAAFADLFRATFTASEGADEGALVGGLARALLETTPADDIRVVAAEDGGRFVGGAIFTRLRYPEDARTVFLLAPVAVATDRQGAGLGQAMLRHGLGALRAEGVDMAITYGDPAYYARVGFAPITAEDARPPQPLTQPEGWIARSLTEAPLAPLAGPSICATALDDPAYW
jgi:predicted N-acetyltransferase YhbS